MLKYYIGGHCTNGNQSFHNNYYEELINIFVRINSLLYYYLQQSIDYSRRCQIHSETFGIKRFTKTHKLLKKTYSSLFLVVDLAPNQGNCSTRSLLKLVKH